MRFRVVAASLALPALLFVSAASRAAEAPGVGPAGRTLSGKLSGETRVSGEVHVTDDVMVLPGATLSAAPGTVFLFDRSDSTKVDPEYFYGGVEIVVRGTLAADNAAFRFPGRTGGIVVDGGRALFSGGAITGAEAGLTVLAGGEAAVSGRLSVGDCRTGVALFPGGRLRTEPAGMLRAAGNGVGFVRFAGAGPAPASFVSEGNEEADAVAWDPDVAPPPPVSFAVPRPPSTAARMSDTFIDHDRTLSGDIVVDGVIRVAPGTTLTLLPGTRLFFTFRDTDGDGIGENGLFLQGNLAARGTKEKPIGFFPSEGDTRGLWDSISFMASDQGENVLEHVDVAGSYRGLHAHFSRLSATDIRIFRCCRGLQFQESEVSLARISVDEVQSAMRGRDATVRIDGLSVRDAVSGVNLFRSAVSLAKVEMRDTGWYGIRLRDSRASFGPGRFSRMYVPLSVQEGTARITGVSVDDSGLAAFSLLEGDVTMESFRSSGSRVDGISASKGSVVLSGGEIAGYGRNAVHLSGPAAVVLKGTKIGSPKGTTNIPVHDGKVVPGLGIVRVE